MTNGNAILRNYLQREALNLLKTYNINPAINPYVQGNTNQIIDNIVGDFNPIEFINNQKDNLKQNAFSVLESYNVPFNKEIVSKRLDAYTEQLLNDVNPTELLSKTKEELLEKLNINLERDTNNDGIPDVSQPNQDFVKLKNKTSDVIQSQKDELRKILSKKIKEDSDNNGIPDILENKDENIINGLPQSKTPFKLRDASELKVSNIDKTLGDNVYYSIPARSTDYDQVNLIAISRANFSRNVNKYDIVSKNGKVIRK